MTKEGLKGYVSDNPDLVFLSPCVRTYFCYMIFTGLMEGTGIARQLLLGSSRLHDTIFRKVMHCPVSFLDVTPPDRTL